MKWKELHREVERKGRATFSLDAAQLPLHRLLGEAMSLPWKLRVTAGAGVVRFEMWKRSRTFAFAPETPHSGPVIALPFSGTSIYLVNLSDQPQTVVFRMQITGGQPLAVSYSGGQISFEKQTTGEVRTHPASFLPGGYLIRVTADCAEPKLGGLNVQASPVSFEEHVLGLPPDQFRRFRAASETARLLTGPSGSYLDAGAGDGELAGFLPGVLSIDTRFLDRRTHLTRTLLDGDLPRCDVALLIDTLEHIPPADRNRLLGRVIEAAKKGVIICAPFESRARIDAEAAVESFLRRIGAAENVHLREHREFGLPSLAETRDRLKAARLHVLELDIQPLSTWTIASTLECVLDRDPQLQPLREVFCRFINRHFPSGLCTRPGDGYETLIVASRARLAPAAIERLHRELEILPQGGPALPEAALPLVLDTLLQDRLLQKDREISRLGEELAGIRASLVQRERNTEDLRADRENWRLFYERAESDRVEKLQHIRNVEADLRAAEARIKELLADQSSRSASASDSSERIRKLQEHSKNLEAEIGRISAENEALLQDQRNRIEIVEELRHRIGSIEKDRDNWQALYKDAEADRVSKIEHIGNLEVNLQTGRSRATDLVADQANRLAERARLEERLSQMEAGLQAMTARREELESHSRNLESEVQRLESENKALSADQANRIAQVAELRERIREIESSLKTFTQRRDELQAHSENLGDEIVRLEAEAASLRLDQANRTSEGTRLRATIEELTARTYEVEARRDELQGHARNLETEIARLQALSESLRMDQANRVEIATELRQRVRSAEEDRDNWRSLQERAEADRQAKIKHIENVQSDLQALRARVSELLVDQATRMSDNDRLRLRLEELEAQEREVRHRRDELQTHTAGLEAERDRVQDEARELEVDRDRLKADAEALEADRDRLQAHASGLEDERDRLKADSKALEADRDRLQARALTLDTQCEHAASENAALRARAGALEADREKWRRLHAEVEADRAAKANHIHGLDIELGRSRERVAALESELAARHVELARTESHLDEIAEALRAVAARQDAAEEARATLERRIRELLQSSSEQAAELARKADHVRQLESTLRQIWASRTWRLLRSVDRVLGRGSVQPGETPIATKPLSARTSGEQGGLRILQTAHFFLPRHVAGAELYTYGLCKELQKRHGVRLLYAERNLAVPQYTIVDGEYDGIPYREVTNNFHFDAFEQTYLDPRMDAIFEDLLESYQPHVVHFQHLLNLSVGMIRVAHRRGVPVVMTLHDYWLTCPSGGQRFRDGSILCESLDLTACSGCFQKSPLNTSRLERRTFALAQKLGPLAAIGIYRILNAVRVRAPLVAKAAIDASVNEIPTLVPQLESRLAAIREMLADADLFISPSAFLRERFVEFGIPAGKIITLANGHVPFEPLPHRASDVLRAAFLGTIAPHKGVHLLIEACRKLPPEQFEVRIFGDMTLNPDYVKQLQAAATGLPVHFEGTLDHARLPDAFADLDVLVVPSIWWENWPLTVNEAFMAQLPVVASAIGGLPELVRPGVNGFLFKPGDPYDLAEKLKVLRANPELLDHFRRNIPKVKTMAEHAGELEAIYRRLAHG